MPGTVALRDAHHSRILDRALVAIRHAHREGGHIVHEEIGEVLRRDHDQCIGAGGGQTLRHAAVGGVEFLRDARIGEVRATRDAGRVAGDPREHQAHTPATFSSIAVVM